LLGDHYGRVLENGALQVRFESGGFVLRVNGTPLPLNPRSYPMILEMALPAPVARLGEEHEAVLELQSIVTGLRHLPPRTETVRARVIERRREKEVLKRRLAALAHDSPEVSAAIAGALEVLNGRRADPHSFDALDALLERQCYRLSFWRVAAEEINYRRFFESNDLAAIRMENPAVFREAHRLLFELVREGLVTGLRIDHPDGLWHPRGYFEAVQLPEDWPVHGTSGYEFAAAVGGVFVDAASGR
jgi:(1->4)-alpha-D-glucan 1-alpha-D-glucosylmutase